MPSSRVGAIAVRLAVIAVVGAGAGAIVGAIVSPPAGGQPARSTAGSSSTTSASTSPRTTTATSSSSTTPRPAFDHQHLNLNGTGHFSAQGTPCSGFTPMGNYPVSLQTDGSKATLTIQGNVPAKGTIDSAGTIGLSNQFYDAQLHMWSNLSGWTGLVTYLDGSQHCPYNVVFPSTGSGASDTTSTISTTSTSTTTAATVAAATTVSPTTEVHATGASSTTGEDAALGGGLALAAAGGAAAVGLARREDERSGDDSSERDRGPSCFDALLFGFDGPSPPMTPMNDGPDPRDVPPEDVIPIEGDSSGPPPDEIM